MRSIRTGEDAENGRHLDTYGLGESCRSRLSDRIKKTPTDILLLLYSALAFSILHYPSLPTFRSFNHGDHDHDTLADAGRPQPPRHLLLQLHLDRRIRSIEWETSHPRTSIRVRPTTSSSSSSTTVIRTEPDLIFYHHWTYFKNDRTCETWIHQTSTSIDGTALVGFGYVGRRTWCH